MGELLFVVVLGGASVLAGIRGLTRGKLTLTPPRGVPYPPGRRELTGRAAIAGSIAAILIGCIVIALAVLRYRDNV